MTIANQLLIDRLGDEMNKKGWSGRALSQAANLSYNAVHYILSGKSKNVRFEHINTIADILGVSPFYLLGQNAAGAKGKRNFINKPANQLASTASEEEDKIPHDGGLYRQIMSEVEETLKSKNKLTTKQVEYFTQLIYPQVKKTGKAKSETKGYIEGIIDYALNAA